MTRAGLAVLLAAGVAHAGGFALPEQDAAATGRSGAALTDASSVTAVQYNPAGLAGIQGFTAAAGLTAIAPLASATDPSTGTSTNAQSSIVPTPHAYVAYGQGKWSAGLGFNAPFGGAVKWPDGWAGRYDVQAQNLQVFSAHLGGAVRLLPQLSLGATVSVFHADILVDKQLDFVDTAGAVEMGGSGNGFGASAGLAWDVNSSVRVGLMGSLPVSVPLTGRAHFDNVPSSFSAQAQDQSLTSRLTLPAKLGLGGSWRLGNYRLFGEAELTFWSAFQSFDVAFANPQTPPVQQPESWRNTPTFRLAAERPVGNWTVRGGAFYDGAASPTDTLSPGLPDSQRIGGSLGAGTDWGRVHADAAYLFVMFLPRRSTGDAYPAQYNASAHLLALTVRYRADQGVPALERGLLAAQP